MLYRVQMHIGDAFHFFRQRGQFKIVRGEQRHRFNTAGETFRAGPGERKAVIGGGAAPDFIHQHQAMLCSVVQDISGFGHLHHKGRTAGGEIVRRADAGENAIDRTNGRLLRGHEAADTGQQHNQRRLSHIGAFTAHVRAGNHQHAALRGKRQRVSDKRLFQHLLHHRVTPAGELNARFVA